MSEDRRSSIGRQQASIGKDENHSAPKKSNWRSAIDPATSRVYYYDSVTRVTQWRKPLELCTSEERREMEEKEANLKNFFSAMEANVLKNIERGDVSGSLVAEEQRKRRGSEGNEFDGDHFDLEAEVGALSAFRPNDEPPVPTRAVRTISSMDDLLLAELTRSKSSNSSSTTYNNTHLPHPSLDDSASSSQIRSLAGAAGDLRHARSVRQLSIERSISTESSDSIDEAYKRNGGSGSLSPREPPNPPPPISPHENSLPVSASSLANSDTFPPRLQHRNSGSTMYVGSTMSAPDKDGLISCVCGMFRAHILQHAREEVRSSNSAGIDGVFKEYDVFNDPLYRGKGEEKMGEIDEKEEEKGGGKSDEGDRESEIMGKVPTLKEVSLFYGDIFRKSQMESDCIIMSLIYVERLLKQTRGGIRLTYRNWKSVIFSSMVMSSKVWDDLSMWNADFSQVCSSFTLQRINELELAYLDALRYSVKVQASEYAKYYFLLRSMLMKSGLGGDHVESLSPLDIEGAKKIEVFSEEYQMSSQNSGFKKRAASMNDMDGDLEVTDKTVLGITSRAGLQPASPPQAKGKRASLKAGVSLEQVVHTKHDAQVKP